MLHTKLKENNDKLLRIILFIYMRTKFKFRLPLLEKACCFIILQENLHNPVYIKFSYSGMAYLFWMCIIYTGGYKQNSFMYGMQLVIWSMLVNTDFVHMCANSHNLSNRLYAAKDKIFGQLWRVLCILFKRIFKFFLT